MGIGTSLGAYFDDEFHHAAARWDDKYDDNVISPNTVDTNRALDAVELDPTTGMGIEVDYKTASPLVTITDQDINQAVDIGLGVSGGGLKLGAAPEKVGKAALQYGDDIFEGTNHGMAFEKLMDKYKDIKDYGKVKDGFMTSNGRFVSREEAMTLAKEADQLIDKGLPPNVTGLLSEDILR